MNKLEKEAMTYVVTEENKSRRRAIPAKDKRDTKRSAVRANRSRAFNNNVLVKAVTMNKEIIIFTIGVWLSGFMAARGMAFWSLLIFILAILTPAVSLMIKINNREEE